MLTQILNPDSIHKDVVICTVPWVDSVIPLMAPATLKSVVEQTGRSCLTLDFNIEVVNFTTKHQHKDQFIKFFFDGVCHADIEDEVFNLLHNMAKQILSHTPEWVGLSLFSYVCQHSARWLCYFLKKLNPDIKIIVGGPGCLNTFTGASPYIDELLAQGLINYHIRGDGEISLIQLLDGNVNYPGINSLEWQELTKDELASLPIPNYDDYKFDRYETPALPIIGSRGCVRQCTFCDYIANWPHFNWRKAKDIFAEMLTQNQKYHLNFFRFQDSLTNGNMKEFNHLMELMAEHNTQNPTNLFRWAGYFIFRDPTPSSDREWEMISQSGAQSLIVGIENLNQHIRFAIGKKFTNDAIIYHLQKAKQYGITCALLNIVGYINEKRADIDYNKQWLTDNTEFKDNILFQWGGTLGIFPNTFLDKNKKELGITMLASSPHQWISIHSTSTPAERASWAKEIQEHSKQLGYRVIDSLDNQFILDQLLNEYHGT